MRRAVRSLFAGLLLLAAGSAAAEPLPLAGNGLDRLAGLMERYSGASRLGWVIAAPDAEEGRKLLRSLTLRLGTSRGHLAERVSTVIADGPPSAHAVALPGGRNDCSWHVTLTDPALPAPSGATAAVPVGNGEWIPASPAATFVVMFSGPLQSTLYAFGETAAGEIRDIAAAPQIAIPVTGTATETLYLIRARKSVPWLAGISKALAAEPGGRRALGADYALAATFGGASRGIGALIQLVDPAMIVADAGTSQPTPIPAPEPKPTERPQLAKDDLAETCVYRLTPLEAM